ncbi:MAG: type II secretion system minor pseudopilin GspI [Hellea sp.]
MSSGAMKDAGFTLIEVLAALLIFSFAIIGLTRAGTESVRAVSVLQNKAYAGIVADNQIIRARIRPLEIGVKTGEESVNGKNYDWRAEISKTESAGFYRVIVSVNDVDSDQVVISRTAFRTDKTL